MLSKLIVAFCMLFTFASAQDSCFNNTQVASELVYLCDITCDTWYYYKHTFNLEPGAKCKVDRGFFESFEVYHNCTKDITATYTSSLFNDKR